ncbi:nose resistant to fluoxetine protein 6-like [Atheta coriaria]|uniref:nose resistant to fluoxetine protein 6-like n=1 Tax=Dalotia coriaria TaxID=877792 RepID=UPI0031F44D40
MVLNNFFVKLLLVAFCVLGVSAELSVNDTREYHEVMQSLNNFSQTFLHSYKDADISPNCKTAMTNYGKGFFNQEEWALKMVDAMSKLQSGIFDGNLYNLGAFDECLSIRDIEVFSQPADGSIAIEMTQINGKYCLGTGILLGIPIFWAMCAPDACSADDLNKIIQIIPIPMFFSEDKCQDPSQEPEITDGDIAVMVVFGIILGIMAVSSLYDTYLRYFEKKTAHPLLLAFSVVTNGEKLFATTEPGTNAGQLECLSGIRSMSMMWVILGHMFGSIAGVAVTKITNIIDFITDGETMYVRGAPVAVDTFFLLAGIVMIYVYLKSTKEKQTFNIFLYYLHRYLRLTPALAAVLVVHLTVLKHFGSGPYWPQLIATAYDSCEKYWWSLLLYIQNYTNTLDMCLPQSWYLSVDTQLFLLSPLVLFPIKRWPRQTLAAVAVAAVASILTGFALAWVHKLNDNLLLAVDVENAEKYSMYYYHATYSRAAPWLIGIIVGYVIYQVKIVRKDQKFKIGVYLNMALWIASLAVMATCVFVDKSQDEYDRLDNSSYIAFVRPAWAIALSWVIFACVTGYGGPVNAFLSARVFQVLARLTYSMYLTHYSVLYVLYLSIKQPMPFTHARVIYEYWSIFALVFAISVVWTLAFESPIIIIEKFIFGGGNKKGPVVSAHNKPIVVNTNNDTIQSNENQTGVFNYGYNSEKTSPNDISIVS